MNRYGRMAYDFTSQHRPRTLAAMTDPTGHFSRLGEEVQGRITHLRDQVLGSQRTGESLEDYRQRSYQAALQAEELVLGEEFWAEAEETVDPQDEEIPAYRSRLAATAQALVSADQSWADTPPEFPPQS